jgi:predicted transcriptional regulator
MRREKILQTLKTADKPLSIEEIAKRVGADVPRLRIDLFRLMGEGKVESRRVGGRLTWTLKVSKPIEERYEKIAKKYTP